MYLLCDVVGEVVWIVMIYVNLLLCVGDKLVFYFESGDVVLIEV